MGLLSITEQMYLVAILCLREDAFGVKIREKVIELTGKTMVFGTLYNNLDQLVRKGYVVTDRKGTDSKTGGNARVYYSVSDQGKEALNESKHLQESLWKAMPRNALI
ncbi:PadR family transcriptional regulator [candidate division KSB1 bacterium]